jgi:hypothetical protein
MCVAFKVEGGRGTTGIAVGGREVFGGNENKKG